MLVAAVLACGVMDNPFFFFFNYPVPFQLNTPLPCLTLHLSFFLNLNVQVLDCWCANSQFVIVE